jgi:hypothetical protein
MRRRRQPSGLVFLAQDATSHVFCYSNADLRKGEQSEPVFQFIAFWKRTKCPATWCSTPSSPPRQAWRGWTR